MKRSLFSRVALEDREVPVPLEDAVANIQVIETLVHSARVEVGLTSRQKILPN